MKTASTISVFVLSITMAGPCGCASNSNQSSSQPAQTTASTTTTTQTAKPAPPPKPKKDKRPIEQRLVVGMTMDQVKAACGNPHNTAMSSDGSATWVYDNGQNAWIPYYMETGNKIHHVTVFFDTNGKVKSWSTADTGMY